MIWRSAVSLVNGQVLTDGGIAESIRFSSSVLAIGDPPRAGDRVIDLNGAVVLPGLVNGHDHLELNHYGRLKGRETYVNASEWIADMRPRLTTDPAIANGRAHPLIERLFVGVVKNLLAGVTLVAHHNPLYRELRRGMPIRILRRYTWAHSFALEREPAGARGEPGGNISDRWAHTASNVPFFVHLAEGVDVMARSELTRLQILGCLASNTVLVHGVGIDRAGWRRVDEAEAGFVWCPASNIFLFGRTVDVPGLGARRERRVRVALGSDSRLTGARDLLDEVRFAHAVTGVPAGDLLAMVTTDAAAVIRQPRAGRIGVGLPADLLVVPRSGGGAADALVAARRSDVQLVTIGGLPVVGDSRWAAPAFEARGVSARPLKVDGSTKLAQAGLVRRIAACPISEPGVTAG